MLFLERFCALLGAACCSSWSGLDVAMHFKVLIAVIADVSSAIAIVVVVIVGNSSPVHLFGRFNSDLTTRGESDGASLISSRGFVSCYLRGDSLNQLDCLHSVFFCRFWICESARFS